MSKLEELLYEKIEKCKKDYFSSLQREKKSRKSIA